MAADASAGAGTVPSTSSPGRTGFKHALSSLTRRVDGQADALDRLARSMSDQGSDVEGLIGTVKAELLGAIADLRAEMLGKIEETNANVERLNKAMTEAKGQSAILSQQSKDSHKRIMEMSEQLNELSLEMHGEEDD